jgi:hypothetical protein
MILKSGGHKFIRSGLCVADIFLPVLYSKFPKRKDTVFRVLAQASGHNHHGNTVQASAQDVLPRVGTQHSCRSTAAPDRREQAKPL